MFEGFKFYSVFAKFVKILKKSRDGLIGARVQATQFDEFIKNEGEKSMDNTHCLEIFTNYARSFDLQKPV